MNSKTMKPSLLKIGIAASLLMLSSGLAGVASAQTVNLTAAPTTTTLPDGQVVPMWGLFCNDAGSGGASCALAKRPTTFTSATWAPPVIRVPAGKLTINLTNHLNFGGAYSAPTSLVIVGQVGGGLGTNRTTMPSPNHPAQGTTWPGTLGGTDAGNGDAVFTPPAQADRVRSMATEITAVASTTTTGTDLVWKNLLPGTYLIESGTEPSIQGAMGLYGIVVVTEEALTAASKQAYGTLYDTDVPLLFSEIDPAQNAEVAQVVQNASFSDLTPWNGQIGKCGDVTVPATSHTCYPPAVNYTPMYYLINGVSFDRTNVAASSLAVPAAGTQANVLLRLVNAGLRMHVPSVVGSKLTLLAEDGNKLPVTGTARIQTEVFLSAGKTYDVAIQPRQTAAGTYDAATLPVYDRALSLSTNNQRDGGMLAYINVAGGATSGVGSGDSATALNTNGKIWAYSCVTGTPLSVADPAIGLLAGLTGANGVALGTSSLPAGSNLSLASNGTFAYTPPASGSCAGSFTFVVNGQAANTYTATISDCTASTSCAGTAPIAGNGAFTSSVASRLQVAPPGVLAFVTNAGGYTLTAVPSAVATSCASVTVNPDGSFVATPSTSTPASCTFNYNASTATKQMSAAEGTITVNFLAPSNLTVNVKDALNGVAVSDYRWIIEEDRTFWIDPQCQINTAGTRIDSLGHACPSLPVESLGYNFHTATMPVVAQGCVGATSCEAGQTSGGQNVKCDLGNGGCEPGDSMTETLPSAVHLDPAKRYFISVLPGDGVNPTIGGAGGAMQVNPDCDANTTDCAMRKFDIAKDCGTFDPTADAWAPGGENSICGHEMGGAQIAVGQTSVNINLQELPVPTAKLSAFVFEDDYPLNGENDAGGGVDVLAPNEPGLGGFEIKLFDQAGGLGDNTGQPTYDEFNQPLSNSLAGYIDPATNLNACPITARKDGLVGMIPTCPTFESDGKTYSPLAGQVVIDNLYAGLYEVQAYPSADRIARGENWLQTNTLDGGAPHEVFLKPNEPGYFQEFGPGNFHVSIGFANPKIINDRKAGFCASAINNLGPCNHTLTVHVTNSHMSRAPDERTYSSGTYDHYSFTTCYVSVGPADAEDFALGTCDANGTVTLTGMPAGTFKIAVFDQWNDIMLDGLVGTLTVDPSKPTTDIEYPVTQWRTDLSTHSFVDTNANGLPDDGEPGLALVNTNVRYRDGSFGFFNNTDLGGDAGFNEIFPFIDWLVVETSSTRYKPEAVHSVYDAGGAVDCSGVNAAPCSDIAAHIASTKELVPLPTALRVPGAVYCNDADCSGHNLITNATGGGATGSSAAIVRPEPWGVTQGWQGLLGQTSYMEFAMRPFAAHENGGVNGHVIYASTRPFDDPSLSLQLSWEPGVARVKVNLYSKTVDANGNEHLTLVDTTTTTSWDDWAQGFRKAADGVTLLKDAHGDYIPNMNCPGQDPTSPFFATLKDSKQWLDPSNPKRPLANHSQFKCYDGWSQLNQVQPAPYDGMYTFPSVTGTDPATGRPTASNCTACVTNPDATDPFRYGGSTTPKAWTAGHGAPMLPPGKYVVEVVVPPGYELVKEEDKNILLGDVYIAPVTQQFAGFGNIFIMPDQAQIGAAYNPSNPGSLNLTNNLGSQTYPRHEGDTGSIEQFWPCVGAKRVVPDLNSLFPGAGQAAPFAGAVRNLCDRKEIDVTDGAVALAKFYVFSSTHIAGHFTGTITNDFASEFDPFSPQFGEKFSPPNLPVALRDFNGNEVARVYSDQWGIFNGLYFSSWSVNPPNPTGYAPQMAIACMNDPGPIVDTRATIIDRSGNTVPNPTLGQTITDPAYSSAYSNFCYEQPFMPGFTDYMDTPVIPTQAFADNYNLPDTEYPDETPAIASVVNSTGSIPGPWVTSGAGTPGHTQFDLSNVTAGNIFGTSGGDTISSIRVGTTTLTNGTITCNLSILCLGTNALGQNARNIVMAAAVAASINARTGATGYSADHPALTATVIISAPTGVANGTALAYTQSGVTFSPTTLAFSGGNSTPAAMALTITALGDKVVQNPNFSGPNSTVAPFDQKTIVRHYGFGDTAGTVTVGGVPLTGVTWNDTTITGTVNATGVPNCAVQQKNAPAAKCGELVITAANGKQSIDAITVTIDGSAPWFVTPAAVTAPAGKSVKDYTANFGRMGFSPIQTAIDSASPGDLIIVTPGAYRENLIMWKPVRLQGVGASSVTVNADAHPAGKMDQWRRQVNCAFGLTLDGRPNPGDTKFAGVDPNNNLYSCPAPMHQRVDRIPFEAIVGWDAAGNGNLAQLLQEPTLMGAYEGAGITVLGRGVRVPTCIGGATNDPAAPCNDFWGVNATGGPGAFADGSVYLGSGTTDCTASTSSVNGRDYGTGNYFCNPSRIDGLSVINSSQGGGGVFIHGWAHNLEVGNTRISGNHGTLAGGINLGNGETPDSYVNDGVECGVTPAALPCPPIPYVSTNGARYGSINNSAIPFQWNVKVHIHHNMIYNNASIGDALFSGTPAGAGAITISAGAEDYLIDHNWMAGNLSTGDGGAVQHLGLSFGGNFSHNYVLFNQSSNPTLPTNGGGLIIEGANLDRQLNGQECGSFTDQDCPPGLTEGAGFGTVVDSNLLLGNSADSGSGGGLRLQQINGADVTTFPTCPVTITSGSGRCQGGWYDVTVTNNIIANNVAGWDGGGVSMQDSLLVTFANNTVVSNDTTASAGVLFKTLGAINAASAPPGCDAQTDPSLPQDPSCTGNSSAHGGQPAGLVTMENTPNMIHAIAALGGSGSVTCPAGFGYTGNTGTNSNRNDCRKLSKPKMVNDLFWQNRSFSVNIIGFGTGNQSQQNLIALTPLVNQASTGACPAFPATNYWDIGLRTDDVASGAISRGNNSLLLNNSLYTSAGSVAASLSASSANNVIGGTTPVVAQFCNGARVPPENCAAEGGQVNQASCRGYNTPVGASETTGLAQVFAFNGIQPTATVDEGQNWLNLVYGPLTLSRPGVSSGTNAELMVASAPIGTVQGAYSLPAGSSAVNSGTNTGLPATTANDFFGNHRAQTTANRTDIGAVEFGAAAAGGAFVAPTNLGFGNISVGSTSDAQTLTLTAGSANLAVTSISASAGAGFARSGGTCGTAAFTLNAGATCTITVTFAPTAVGAVTGSVTITADAAVAGSPVPLSGSGSKVDLTVSPGPLLQFGDVFVGLGSAAQTVTLSNTSSPATAVTGIRVAGLTGGPFTRSGTTGVCSTTAPFTLAAGASCTINVVFTPAVANPVNGLLTVTATGGFVVAGSPLQMTGNGLLPTVSPAELAFGNVPVGTPVQQTLTLDNSANVNSTANFPVNTLAVAGAGYSRNGGTCGNAPFTLNAGTTCTIIVRFSQTAGTTPTGATTGTVTIRGNGGATNLPVVNLTANSVAPTYTASLAPGSVAYGNVIVTTSATQDLTVMNTGNSALGNITITGVTTSTSPFTRITNGGGFPAAAPNCGTTLAIGASCTIRVRFAPTALGSASATVTVGGGSTNSPHPAVSAALSGTGTAPPAPGIPGNRNASRGGNGNPITATLTWNAAQYATSYDVQWSRSQGTINGNGGAVIAGVNSPYTFNGGAVGIPANTTVYFKVRAVNITGKSNWSPTFSSTVR